MERLFFAGSSIQLTCSLLAVDLEEVLKETGIPLNRERITDASFSADELAAFYKSMTEKYGCDDFHLRVGKGHVGHIYGTGEIAFAVSKTVGEALHRLCKIKGWAEPMGWCVDEADDAIAIQLRQRYHESPCNALLEAASFIYVIEALRFHLRQPVTAKAAQLTYPVPHLEKVEEALGCPIIIGPGSVLTLDSALAEQPLGTAYPAMARQDERVFMPQPGETSREESFLEKTERLIKENLQGDFDVSAIAQLLQISRRTFERRLADEGTSYRKVLDGIRSALALEYLQAQKLPLAEAAYLLGFQESNSFGRAFKRWFGTTPANYARGSRTTMRRSSVISSMAKRTPSRPSPESFTPP